MQMFFKQKKSVLYPDKLFLPENRNIPTKVE